MGHDEPPGPTNLYFLRSSIEADKGACCVLLTLLAPLWGCRSSWRQLCLGRRMRNIWTGCASFLRTRGCVSSAMQRFGVPWQRCCSGLRAAADARYGGRFRRLRSTCTS